MWSIGPESALIALDALLYDFIGSMVYQQASEIHLCADVQGWDVSTLDWQNTFVSRVVRIRPDLTIWCVEFRIKRKFLATFHLNEAFSVLSQLELLWKYATMEWLRYVDLSASSDTNKSRLPTHSAWEVIQEAYSSQDATTIPQTQAALVKQARTMAKRKVAIAGAVGYMRSAVALAGDEVGGVRPEDVSNAIISLSMRRIPSSSSTIKIVFCIGWLVVDKGL